MSIHLLQNDDWQVGILPEIGASITDGRIKRGGAWVDFMRPTPPSDYHNPNLCASYILVPWSNRIRDAHFRFKGKDYQLKVNYKDGTAIHGVGKGLPWQVAHADDQRLLARFNSADHADINFPFRFSSTQEFVLDGKSFVVHTTLKNEDSAVMPGGFGHHPYFVRMMGGDGVQVQIPGGRHYPLEACMPLGGSVPITEERLNFTQLKALQPENYPTLIDDLFTGHHADQPVRFVYGDTEIQMHSGALYKHIVMYAPADKPFFALEPVTNANDGFNLHDKGITESNVLVLQPSEEARETFMFEIIKS
jgi:aldose 1-epimerase